MTELIRIDNQNTGLATNEAIGKAANAAADRNTFNSYISKRADNTKRRHARELQLFGEYLSSIGFVNNGMTTPEQWTGITHGIIEGYVNYLLIRSYSISTINQTLTIIKLYAKLAGKSKYIQSGELYEISEIKGYKPKDAYNTDNDRMKEGISTRREQSKKANNTKITRYQAEQLKHSQPDTIQGLRDTLLITILLDHGPRISEVISLTFNSINLEENTITFYRQKVYKTDKHEITDNTRTAIIKYFSALHEEGISIEPDKSIWVGTDKWGHATGTYSIRAAQSTVKQLGESIGLVPLSPHDCRHYYATAAKRGGTDSLDIMRAGGWSTPTMVNRYIDQNPISNANVKLG